MTSAPDSLFVYGTLRRGFSLPPARRLHTQADYLGTGWWQARLYDLGRYPGACPSTNLTDRVWGDLFRVPAASPLWSWLDHYEGCSPEYPEPHEYRREVVWVHGETGKGLWAWTYIYQGPLDGARHLASGTYQSREM